jgi:hypothetical protein
VTEIAKRMVVELNLNGIAIVRWVEMRDPRAGTWGTAAAGLRSCRHV